MTTYAVFGPGQIKTPGAEKQPYQNKDNVYLRLNDLKSISMLLLGGGKGVDRHALEWAKQHGVEYRVYPPHYDDANTVGVPSVFMLRDSQMLADCQSVIVFTQPGLTGHTRIISDAVMLKKPVMVFSV